MPIARSGKPDSLWKAFAAGANATSTPVMVSRDADQCAIFITVSAATTISLEVAHHGTLTSEGDEPSQNAPPATFMQAYYLNGAIQIVFAGAGSASMIIPDFVPAWIRLRTSAAATITAGHEVTGG